MTQFLSRRTGSPPYVPKRAPLFPLADGLQDVFDQRPSGSKGGPSVVVGLVGSNVCRTKLQDGH